MIGMFRRLRLPRTVRSASGWMTLVNGMLLAGIGVLGLVVHLTMTQASDVSGELMREVDLGSTVSELQYLIQSMRILERDATFFAADPNSAELRVAQWQEVYASATRLLDRLHSETAGGGDPQALQRIESTQRHVEEYSAGFKDVMAAVVAGKIGDPQTAVSALQEPRQASETALKELSDFSSDRVSSAGTLRNEFAQTLSGVRYATYVSVASFLLIGTAASWWLRLSIVRPLLQAGKLANEVAKGELLAEVPGQRLTEYEQLFAALSSMQEGLRGVVSGMSTEAQIVASAATEIAMGNADLSLRAENRAVSLQTIALAVDGLSQSVRRMASSTIDLNQRTEAMRRACHAGAAAGVSIQTAVERIAGHSQQIKALAQTINRVSMQTKLLAVNVAVEAATSRHDKANGMNPVAHAVRELAVESDAAAQAINSLAAKASEDTNEVLRLANETRSSIAAIAELAERSAEGTQRLSDGLQEQQREADELAGAAGGLEELGAQDAAMVEQAAASAASLRESAQRLLSTVRVFKIS